MVPESDARGLVQPLRHRSDPLPQPQQGGGGSCSHHHIAGHMQPRPPEPLPVLKAKGMISLEFAEADGRRMSW